MNMRLEKLTKQSIIIIPVRMGSSRFPGKPLAKIKLETMVGRIYRICKSSLIKNVVVATCDNEIVDHLKKIDAVIILTKWDTYYSLSGQSNRNKLKNKVIIDPRRQFDPKDFRESTYLTIGRRLK